MFCLYLPVNLCIIHSVIKLICCTSFTKVTVECYINHKRLPKLVLLLRVRGMARLRYFGMHAHVCVCVCVSAERGRGGETRAC